MLNLFIDTNILLRFYAYSDDTLTEVEKITALQKNGDLKILITEQIVEEHFRNRDRELNESLKRIDGLAGATQIPRFAEHYEDAKVLREAFAQAKSAKTALMNSLKDEIAEGNLRADKVIDQLFASTPILKRTEDIVVRARLRRELGNPPGKKDSLGDQINWEILLDNVDADQDIHIVSKDGDFKGQIVDNIPNSFLAMEWKKVKGADIFIYSGLAEFAKKHFPTIKIPSDAVKTNAVQKLVLSGNFTQTHEAISELEQIFDDINSSDALTIMNAALDNSQVGWIISDDDVKAFYRKLYLKHWPIIPLEIDDLLTELDGETFGVPF